MKSIPIVLTAALLANIMAENFGFKPEFPDLTLLSFLDRSELVQFEQPHTHLDPLWEVLNSPTPWVSTAASGDFFSAPPSFNWLRSR
jgi:hypothetical protein